MGQIPQYVERTVFSLLLNDRLNQLSTSICSIAPTVLLIIFIGFSTLITIISDTKEIVRFKYQSHLCKQFECNFWWNFLNFSDKMDLTTQMKIFNNVKQCHANCLKLFFTSLTILGYEAKVSIYSAVKENLILYCHKFAALPVTIINKHILITRPASLEKEIANFAVESLVLPSRLFNGTLHLRYKTSLVKFVYANTLYSNGTINKFYSSYYCSIL